MGRVEVRRKPRRDARRLRAHPLFAEDSANTDSSFSAGYYGFLGNAGSRIRRRGGGGDTRRLIAGGSRRINLGCGACDCAGAVLEKVIVRKRNVLALGNTRRFRDFYVPERNLHILPEANSTDRGVVHERSRR